MNRFPDSIFGLLEALPTEWLLAAVVIVVPALLLLLVRGLARISGRRQASVRPSPVPPSEDEELPPAEAEGPQRAMGTGAPSPPAAALPKVSDTRKAPAPPETPEPRPEPEAFQPTRGTGFLERLKTGLSKTRRFLSADIDALFAGKHRLDENLLESLVELLITADLGVDTTTRLIEKITARRAAIGGTEELKAVLKEEILSIVGTGAGPATGMAGKPHVIMVVGVNGVGKTTTIGKLAARYGAEGKKVLIAAADTFRAAAMEQLSIWADRSGADIVRHRDKADPAAVAFDAIEAAISREADVVLVDTAGRLHTRVNLMEELKKIKRTIARKIPEAPHETLLVLDATTGQNALSQARLFNEALDVTGLALTKLDGTAKGGIVVGICGSLKIPLRYIGVGERIDDLQLFDPVQFTQALF